MNFRGKFGNYICGEMKLALTLRFLAGASYLDLFLWSDISPNYIITVARSVMKNWICNDRVIKIDFTVKCLQIMTGLMRLPVILLGVQGVHFQASLGQLMGG